MYISSLAGWDLGLAVGRCSCSVGVTRPNDASSYTGSHSDSPAVTSGMNWVKEIGHFTTLHDKGHKVSNYVFHRVRVFTSHSVFHFTLHL